ncbi:hypothetical protein Pcinc_012348 [Petrolisthes cinctipes]|nr:hypothetical protein Pcinc_012348 [Petrolisthes cinctipes]
MEDAELIVSSTVASEKDIVLNTVAECLTLNKHPGALTDGREEGLNNSSQHSQEYKRKICKNRSIEKDYSQDSEQSTDDLHHKENGGVVISAKKKRKNIDNLGKIIEEPPHGQTKRRIYNLRRKEELKSGSDAEESEMQNNRKYNLRQRKSRRSLFSSTTSPLSPLHFSGINNSNSKSKELTHQITNTVDRDALLSDYSRLRYHTLSIPVNSDKVQLRKKRKKEQGGGQQDSKKLKENQRRENNTRKLVKSGRDLNVPFSSSPSLLSEQHRYVVRVPADGNYYVVRYPTKPVPTECPMCHFKIFPAMFAYDPFTSLATLRCFGCPVTIYVTQEPSDGFPVPEVVFSGSEEPITTTVTPMYKPRPARFQKYKEFLS